MSHAAYSQLYQPPVQMPMASGDNEGVQQPSQATSPDEQYQYATLNQGNLHAISVNKGLKIDIEGLNTHISLI